MDFGQYAASAVVLGTVLVSLFAKYMSDSEMQSAPWQRGVAYFGAGVLSFGLAACVLVSAGASIHFS